MKHNATLAPSVVSQDDWLKKTFPGFGEHPVEIIKKFVTSNPSKTLKSKWMMDRNLKECEYDDNGNGQICPTGWTQFASLETKDIYCFKNLGKSIGKDDLCLEDGARRIQFNSFDRSFENLLIEFLGNLINCKLKYLNYQDFITLA